MPLLIFLISLSLIESFVAKSNVEKSMKLIEKLIQLGMENDHRARKCNNKTANSQRSYDIYEYETRLSSEHWRILKHISMLCVSVL